MIFVTGGTGFIGSHLLQALAQQGEPVRALKRSSSIPAGLDTVAGIEWVDGDILDVSSLEAQMEGCSEVYHCAGMVSFQRRHRDALRKVNVEGTANVVNVALSKKNIRLLHVSSVAAIGRPAKPADINEATEWDFNGFNSQYAVSKYLGEREVWRGIAEGLNAVIVNPSIVIGEGNWKTGPPRFFLDVWKGLWVYTSGSTGFVAAKDVAGLMIALMKSNIEQEKFIINAENLSYRDFLFEIADAMGKKRPVMKADGWLTSLVWRLEYLRGLFLAEQTLISRETATIAQLSCRYDNSKLVKALNFQFTPMKQCIAATAALFKADVAAGKIK